MVELAVPALAERYRATPWHRHHIIERYGLLNIFILGEILLSISFMMGPLYSHGFDWALISAALASLMIVFTLSGGSISSRPNIWSPAGCRPR
ncbi:low temperature requirement protein A [Pseudodonghicola xiamenensis]|uniref:Uncharacterized protein n=1 Tax=Pseudodonghicola xiamenensis TaxID=337702 RepID=A0A8J3HA99_9RHOB|nr:low temperature requirement protein A [Pseudodonghicola xiamenensis]GHG94846.1 hypothetical protein GCM10010961_28160 [Pseudodonghicola xiamenensis]